MEAGGVSVGRGAMPTGFENLEMEDPLYTGRRRWTPREMVLLITVPTALAGMYATILLLA